MPVLSNQYENYYKINDNDSETRRQLDTSGTSDNGISDTQEADNQSVRRVSKHATTDSKPNKHNGIKLVILLVLIIIIVTGCYYLSRKMTNYIESEKTVTITQPRKGRLGLYKGLKFKRMEDEPGSEILNTSDFKYDGGFPSPDHYKTAPNTGRELMAYEEEKPSAGLMLEEEKFNMHNERNG